MQLYASHVYPAPQLTSLPHPLVKRRALTNFSLTTRPSPVSHARLPITQIANCVLRHNALNVTPDSFYIPLITSVILPLALTRTTIRTLQIASVRSASTYSQTVIPATIQNA